MTRCRACSDRRQRSSAAPDRLVMLGLLLVAMACQRVDEKSQDAAEDDVAIGSDADRVCGAGFTACVHSCGEKDDSEPTAADCTDGVYRCPAPLVPAIED